MGYNLELNYADRVRFGMAVKDTGIDGASLAKELLRAFFARQGVKNPAARKPFSPQNHCAHKV